MGDSRKADSCYYGGVGAEGRGGGWPQSCTIQKRLRNNVSSVGMLLVFGQSSIPQHTAPGPAPNPFEYISRCLFSLSVILHMSFKQ